MSKKIGRQAITGAKGVNRLEAVVLDMGFTWAPTPGTFDAGIDGTIEIRDPTTGEAMNRIIQVQSKATEQRLQGETATTFEYVCEQRDIDYWLSGNAPVILVVSRPHTEEIYWKPLKQWFADSAVRATRKVRFHKIHDRFDKSCADALVALASPFAAGLYRAPPPKEEKLLTNLLQVVVRARHVYFAPSKYSTVKEALEALRRVEMRLHPLWFIRGGEVLSLRPFTDEEWCIVAKPKDAYHVPIDAWSKSDDPVRQREFARLLGRGLEGALPKDVRHRIVDGKHIYFFTPTPDLQEREVTYLSHSQQATATVYAKYLKPSEEDGTLKGYCRSHAFQGRFCRFDDEWWLQVLPTYWFTTVEGTPHPNSEHLMKGIKRLEGQQAIAGQLRLWSHVLSGDPLIQSQRIVSFVPMLELPIGVGIDDKAWQRPGETDMKDEEKQAATEGERTDRPTPSERSQPAADNRQLSLFGPRSK